MLYQKSFQVIWANLDPNMHLRHTAYNDYAAQVRLDFFLDHGFTMSDMTKFQIGPILFKEETKFLREVAMNETIHINCELTGLRADGSKWNMQHYIYKSNNILSAIVSVEGAWLDLIARKIKIPPIELLNVLNLMPKSEKFEWIPDKII